VYGSPVTAFLLLCLLCFLCFLVGHTVLAINGQPAEGRFIKDEKGTRDILDLIAGSENYPIAIKFGRPKLSSNEKIMLAGMFHS
jgi:hypothetical protein